MKSVNAHKLLICSTFLCCEEMRNISTYIIIINLVLRQRWLKICGSAGFASAVARRTAQAREVGSSS